MLVAVLVWMVTALADLGGQPLLPQEPLAIETAPGKALRFQVEMALTPHQQAVGLMYRKRMPEGHGMFFDFGHEREGVAFWMKNTIIPLDMIFIDGRGQIVRVAARTTPLSEAQVPAGAPARAVLEIAGGEAERLGIKQGQRVRHRVFGDAKF
ncbi:MAG TPA: DUF192 domain-containing protein [Alphaproteobacteria bacterium]|nr:DUF192 domain-containing protein [Alphaproteobacteria bacterium]